MDWSSARASSSAGGPKDEAQQPNARAKVHSSRSTAHTKRCIAKRSQGPDLCLPTGGGVPLGLPQDQAAHPPTHRPQTHPPTHPPPGGWVGPTLSKGLTGTHCTQFKDTVLWRYLNRAGVGEERFARGRGRWSLSSRPPPQPPPSGPKRQAARKGPGGTRNGGSGGTPTDITAKRSPRRAVPFEGCLVGKRVFRTFSVCAALRPNSEPMDSLCTRALTFEPLFHPPPLLLGARTPPPPPLRKSFSPFPCP